jgi:hypothetical protein
MLISYSNPPRLFLDKGPNSEDQHRGAVVNAIESAYNDTKAYLNDIKEFLDKNSEPTMKGRRYLKELNYLERRLVHFQHALEVLKNKNYEDYSISIGDSWYVGQRRFQFQSCR